MQHFFTALKPLWLFAHMLGVVVGLGSAIVADTLFFKFLKDLRISKKESEVLSYVSHLVVLGLIMLIISGGAIFLSDPVKYLASSKFITKMVIVAVIAINGFALHKRLSPHLREIQWDAGAHAKNRPLRKLAFALGAISSTSWFSALLLGYVKSIPANTLQALGGYACLLILAVGASQLVELYLTHYMDKK